jgi:MFS family permease
MHAAEPIVRTPARGPHYGLVVLGLVVLVVFSALGLGRHGYTIVLPAMQEALHLTNTQTGTLQSWNLVGYLSTVILAGFLASRHGPRLVITIALGITAAGMVVTGCAPSFGAIGAGRFLAGAGGAGANVPAMGLVSAWFGPRRRGVAAGVAVAGSSLGLVVTGPLAPLILSRSAAGQGWRIWWLVLAMLTLAVLVAAAIFLRNRPAEQGLQPIGQAGPDTPAGPAAAGSLAWGQVCRSRRLWHLAAIYFAFGFSYIIYSTFFVRHLTSGLGYTRDGAGALWFQVGVVSILSGFIWGSVSDHWGRRCALLWVFCLQGASFLLLGLSRQTAGLYASAILFAFTAWSIPALMAAVCGDLFGARLAPAALGLITIVFGVGQALGPYLAGRMADATQSFSAAFILAGAVALILGAGGSFLLAGHGRRPA